MSILLKNATVVIRKYIDSSPSIKSILFSLFKPKIKNYTNFTILNNINLNIIKGEKVGIIGKNGAGKSSLLKVINKIYSLNSGMINIKGRVASLIEIGSGFNPNLTGRENMKLLFSLNGFSSHEYNDFQNNVIEFSELGNFIDTQTKFYSTGMNLRLGLSICLYLNPNILILDEMFAGSDKDFIKKSLKKLNSIIDKVDILIIVTHDLKFIKQLCNRVLWINNGKIICDGSTKYVINKYINNDLNS